MAHGQRLFRIDAAIERGGLFIPYVLSDGRSAPWAYTIGLTEVGHPELVLYGADEESTARFLNWIGHRIVHHGERLPVGRQARELAGAPIRYLPVPAEVVRRTDVVLWAVDYYGSLRRSTGPVEALQCMWADRHGLFPWQAGFDESDGSKWGAMPLLDEVRLDAA